MAILKMSRGRRLLLAVLQVTTTHDVAARCRVTHPAVSYWASGLCTPSRASRVYLERNYCIPCEAWDIAFVSLSRDTGGKRAR